MSWEWGIADLFGFGPSGVCVLVDVSLTCLTGDSAMRSRGEVIRGRVEALLRYVEMRNMRNPRIEAATRACSAFFVPFALSPNSAHGACAYAFLKQVFWFVKKEGRPGMRRSSKKAVVGFAKNQWPGKVAYRVDCA